MVPSSVLLPMCVCTYLRTYIPLSCSTSLCCSASLCCCRSVQLQPKLADSYWQRHLLSLIQGNTQVHTLYTLVHVSVCTLFAGLRTYVRTYAPCLVRTSTAVSCSSIVYSLHCVSIPDNYSIYICRLCEAQYLCSICCPAEPTALWVLHSYIHTVHTYVRTYTCAYMYVRTYFHISTLFCRFL